MFCFVLFFNVSNSIKNVIWLLTVEDPMDVFFFSLAIALKMQYGCWQLKILWLTVLAHGVGIKINGIFCYFLSFNLFFFFFAYCIPIILVSFHQVWLKKSHQLAFLFEMKSAIMKGQLFDVSAWLKQNIPPWLRQEKRQSRPIVL